VVIGHYNRMTRLVNQWREQARKLAEYQPIRAENLSRAKALAECANQLETALEQEKLETIHA